MIHVIKYDMDPNSNKNYHRKIPPICQIDHEGTDHRNKIPARKISTKPFRW